MVSDLGISGGSNWTVVGSDIYRNSAVAIGRTTIPTNSTFAVQSLTANSALDFFVAQSNAGTNLMTIREGSGYTYFLSPTISIGVNTFTLNQFRHRATVNGNAVKQLLFEDNLGVEFFSVDNIGRAILRNDLTLSRELIVGGATTLGGYGGATIRGSNDGVDGFRLYNQSSVLRVRWRSGLGLEILNTSGVRTISLSNNLTLDEGTNIISGTTTGTKIGTATTQKLSFWNATPIIQPTTAVTASTLVSNAGTTLTSTDTFDGYTLAQIVKALRNTGLLA